MTKFINQKSISRVLASSSKDFLDQSKLELRVLQTA